MLPQLGTCLEYATGKCHRFRERETQLLTNSLGQRSRHPPATRNYILGTVGPSYQSAKEFGQLISQVPEVYDPQSRKPVGIGCTLPR